jgi:GLPGLI family protein
MNIIIRAVFLISFGSSILSAQDFQGIATYKTKDKIEIELDSTQAGGMQDEIMAMLQKQFEKTYVLSFDQEQSVYKEDEELATPSLGSDMIIISSSGTEILYKNIKDERYTKQSDFLGKIFLIQDTLHASLVQPQSLDDVVVVLFHDHGTRYVGKMFNDNWMREMGYIN